MDDILDTHYMCMVRFVPQESRMCLFESNSEMGGMYSHWFVELLFLADYVRMQLECDVNAALRLWQSACALFYSSSRNNCIANNEAGPDIAQRCSPITYVLACHHPDLLLH